MARARKASPDLTSFVTQRARILAELAALDEAEKAAIESQRDAGREPLLAALAKVKIGPMNRAQAKAIAHAISSTSADEIIQKLGAVAASK